MVYDDWQPTSSSVSVKKALISRHLEKFSVTNFAFLWLGKLTDSVQCGGRNGWTDTSVSQEMTLSAGAIF